MALMLHMSVATVCSCTKWMAIKLRPHKSHLWLSPGDYITHYLSFVTICGLSVMYVCVFFILIHMYFLSGSVPSYPPRFIGHVFLHVCKITV